MQEQETIKLHGTYECRSGAKYKFYGRSIAWVPGAEKHGWQVTVFHHDKVFKHDSVENSPDMLCRLSNYLLNMQVGSLMHPLAMRAVEEAIEEWDRAKAGSVNR